MSETKKTILFVFGVVWSFIFLIVVTILFMVNLVLEPKCETTGRLMQRDVVFKYPGGCYIQMDDGTYIHESNFIVNEPNAGSKNVEPSTD